ncbi:AAA family ATPase [Biformimicrobium ophioploci]|uniref:AAA family ATPase n=1 Tax=Biformimicrobium ophioploci TaxID=3036711 RepID=A0ABQ6LUR6_9GAMM|nr:MoxR family ATPase [Microbulbifer sp. NKW57]GMG85814.1 AAA family ATPase [Microbulbifer sp. NKW57]
MEAHKEILRLRATMQNAVLGQEDLVDKLLLAMLADGHLLLEGLPGSAKTRAIKALAAALDAPFGRIQFTPDLLPSDVTGTEVYHSEGGRETLSFQPGPVFNSVVLADEINRAPAKVQSSLLEAMEERQVTVAGKTHKLPALFLVMATQNPIEQEGTYPLPEAQLDRFLMKVRIDYPDDDNELRVMRLVRGEEGGTAGTVQPVAVDSVLEARRQIREVAISEAMERYIVGLVAATRRPEEFGGRLPDWLKVGVSPRASIAMDRCARANAWLQGRHQVEPDDIRSVAHPVLRHRLILHYEAEAQGVDSEQLIDELLGQVAVAV